MRDRISLMTFTMDIDVAMRKLTAMDILSLAKEEGISYVDIMEPSPKQLEAYRDAFQRTGIQPQCYIGTVSFFSNSEEKIRKLLCKHLQDAASLKANRYMIVPVNPQKDEKICNRLGRDEVRKRLVQFFKLAVQLGNEQNIPVCFETTPREYTCLSGSEDCLWVLERVPRLGLVYDTANMLPHGEESLSYYETIKPYIVHVHLKDVSLLRPKLKDRLFHSEMTKDGQVMQCCPPGQGGIPLKQIVSRMEQDGYKGLYALEYSHPDTYPANLSQHAQRLKVHMEYWK